MEPIFFGDCFGMLHGAQGRRGVVLCSPFGYDALCTHRGWRRLAEALDARGLPTLRFDFPGTGDAAGIEQDPGRVDAWLDGIDAAIDLLKTRAGVTEITLCGFRLGGLLAASAAARRTDIDALVLLSPVISGRTYVRELRAHRQRWLTTPSGLNSDPLPDSADYVEAYGFGLHGDDVKRLASLDLTKLDSRPAARMLILDSVDRTRVNALAAHCTALGSAVETDEFDEADRFMLEALHSQLPQRAFARTVDWLAQGLPGAVTDTATAAREHTMPATPASLRLASDNATETAVSFATVDATGHYFGIHCTPDQPDPDLPAVLFCNTGASHHIGDGRMFVLFARRLARLGMTSLRMDLAGIGDSVPLSSEVTLDTIYSDASNADFAAGAAWLAARGHRRVVVFGVCGGAFNGLHAARLDPHIVGCVGVNLQKFIWDGESRQPGTLVLAQSRLYWRSAFSAKKWLQALKGQAKPGRALRAVSQRAWRIARARTRDALGRLRGVERDVNPIHGLVRQLNAKDVQVRLLYGEYDVGLEELKIHFGHHGHALQRYPAIRVVLLPKLDHALFTEAAREAVMRDTEAWLTAHMRATPAQEAPRRQPDTRPAADWFHAGGGFADPVRAPDAGLTRRSDAAPHDAHLPAAIFHETRARR